MDDKKSGRVLESNLASEIYIDREEVVVSCVGVLARSFCAFMQTEEIYHAGELHGQLCRAFAGCPKTLLDGESLRRPPTSGGPIYATADTASAR